MDGQTAIQVTGFRFRSFELFGEQFPSSVELASNNTIYKPKSTFAVVSALLYLQFWKVFDFSVHQIMNSPKVLESMRLARKNQVARDE